MRKVNCLNLVRSLESAAENQVQVAGLVEYAISEGSCGAACSGAHSCTRIW